MKYLIIPTVRRLGTIIAGLILSLGGLVVASPAPAQALGCNNVAYHEVSDGNYVDAERYRVCDTDVFDLGVEIDKLTNGTWQKVAFAAGAAIYYCNGSTQNQFRATGAYGTWYDFSANCG